MQYTLLPGKMCCIQYELNNRNNDSSNKNENKNNKKSDNKNYNNNKKQEQKTKINNNNKQKLTTTTRANKQQQGSKHKLFTFNSCSQASLGLLVQSLFLPQLFQLLLSPRLREEETSSFFSFVADIFQSGDLAALGALRFAHLLLYLSLSSCKSAVHL